MKFQKKPEWIKVRPPGGPVYNEITALLRQRKLHTVCEEARCPNIAECWNEGTATLMLMGDVCTRGCRFCAVQSGIPRSLDPHEAARSAETVQLMRLRYVVLTSVNRDDLPDGGARHFAHVIQTIKRESPDTLIEALVPDFQGDTEALKVLLEGGPDVFAHNIETVSRLSPAVRDRRASYGQSLKVLEDAKQLRPGQWTKSSVMVGLGESEQELRDAFRDLREVNVDFLTIGQYLKPTAKHLDVVEFLPPERFDELKTIALSYGFTYVASGPLVRSSYRAGEHFISNVIRSGTHALPVWRSSWPNAR